MHQILDQTINQLSFNYSNDKPIYISYKKIISWTHTTNISSKVLQIMQRQKKKKPIKNNKKTQQEHNKIINQIPAIF